MNINREGAKDAKVLEEGKKKSLRANIDGLDVMAGCGWLLLVGGTWLLIGLAWAMIGGGIILLAAAAALLFRRSQ